MPASTSNYHHLPSPRSSPPRSTSPTVPSPKCNATSTADLHDLLTTTGENAQHHLSYRSSPTQTPRPIESTTKKPAFTSILSVIQKYISGLEGRDKSIKIIQYFFKLLLYYRWVEAKRWSKMVSHFSQTRKILRVGHCISTIQDMITAYSSSPTKDRRLKRLTTWCTLFVTLGNEVADDLYCFYRMGVIVPSVGKKAEKVSIYCWFICIWIDLKSNMGSLHTLLEQQQQQQETGQKISLGDQFNCQQKIFLARLSCVKLMMDGLFCACDIWEPSFSTGVQAWAGFFSGTLSGYKLWCRNRTL